MEVPIGFEPMITELQSIALPLGYGTMVHSFRMPLALFAPLLYNKFQKLQALF